MRAVIFAGGRVEDYDYIKQLIKPDDFIIAADSGYRHTKALGIVPDIMIGDFDSVEGEFDAPEIIRLNVMKDETDTEAASMLAAERGADELLILGAIGSRQDHSLANLLLLKKLYDKGIAASVADEKNRVYYLEDSIKLEGKKGQLVSILPLSELCGVSTTGLFYKLSDDTLYMGAARGVSNVMTEDVCTISLKSGCALITMSED